MCYENDPVKEWRYKVKLFGMLARLTDEQMAQLEEYLKNLIEIKEG